MTDVLPRAMELLTEAGDLLVAAGADALTAGAPADAVTILTRASEVLTQVNDPAMTARAVLPLIEALAEAGQADQAHALTTSVDALECAGITTEQLALLRLRLARADAVAGEYERGLARIQDACPPRPRPGADRMQPIGQVVTTVSRELQAERDALAACLITGLPGARTGQQAETLARRTLAAADGSRPELRCQAWHVLGTLARPRDLAGSSAWFQQVRLLANQHRLPAWRLQAQLALAVNAWLATGATSRLGIVHQAASDAGALGVACSAQISIILDHIFRGRYRDAAWRIRACRDDAGAAGLTGSLRWLALADAVRAAHQGRRSEMEAALAAFRAHGGAASRLAPLAATLATAVCAALEDDTGRASRDSSWTGPFPWAAGAGLHQLLCAVADRGRPATAGGAAGRPVAGPPFWDRPLLLFRRAVLAGRRGDSATALATFVNAEQMAAPYPLVRHLGVRLVAQAAIQDRWGSPEVWLRQAEQYFHQHPGPAAANACRSLLRRTGATAPQRRRDVELIPPELRVLGVTVREHEVLNVLMEHASNQDIAAKLHISLRTVEKHVSSLLLRTGQPHRAALIRFTAALGQRAPGGPAGDSVPR